MRYSNRAVSNSNRMVIINKPERKTKLFKAETLVYCSNTATNCQD